MFSLFLSLSQRLEWIWSRQVVLQPLRLIPSLKISQFALANACHTCKAQQTETQWKHDILMDEANSYKAALKF